MILSSLNQYIKHIIYFFIGLIIALSITVVVVIKYANPIAEYLIKKGVSNATDELYNIKFNKIDFDFLKGDLQLTALEIEVDSLIFQKQQAANIAPESLFNIKSDTTTIEGISWFRLLGFNFYASSIKIKKPTILATQIAKPKPENNKDTQTDKTFDKITFGELVIKEGNVQVLNIHKKTKHKTENINLEIKDLKASFDEDLELRKRFSASDIQLDFTALYTQLNNQDIFQIENFRFSNKDQLLTLNNLSINDTILADKQQKEVNQIKIPAFKISGADLLKAWESENLILKAINVDKADIKLSLKNSEGNKDTFEIGNLYKYLSPAFQSVAIDTIEIQEVSLAINQKTKENTTRQNAEKIRIKVEQFKIDSTTQNKPQQFYYAQKVFLNVEDYSTNLGSKLYDLKLRNLKLSGEDNITQLTGLQLIPRYSKAEFSKQVEFRTDRITLNAGQINIKDLDIKKLIRDNTIFIDEIEINDASLEAFRDVSVPIKQEEKPIPQIALRNSSTSLLIKKTTVSKADIVYKELQADNNEAAQIELKDTYAIITNITNRKADLKNNNKMEVQINTMLMGQSKISSKIEIDLVDKKGKYSFKGEMERFDLALLNPLLIPMAKIKATEGVIEKMDFEIRADNDYAIGNMNVYYNDLKIDLVNEDGEKEGFIKKAGTVLLNNLAIKSNNPTSNKFRPGMVDAIRKKNTSIFNHWAKSLVSGLLSSLTTRPAESISKKKVIKNDEEYQQ